MYNHCVRLPDIPLIVLDTETTGFVPREHDIIEFASVRCEKGEIVDTYEHLFFAEEIPPHVEVLTRIKTPDVRDAPRFDDKRKEVLSHLEGGGLLVGQNIPFDLGMLKGHGIDLTERPWIDTSMLASLVFPELESYSLGYLSEVLHLNHAPKHRALGDVRATLELLSKCWERLLEATPLMQEQMVELFERSSPGYRLLAHALPASKVKKEPAWLSALTAKAESQNIPRGQALLRAKKGEIALQEEPIDPGFLASLIEESTKETSTRTWFGVKNLDASVRRLSRGLASVRVISPPNHLLDTEAAKELFTLKELLSDEAILALKIAWYKPRTRNDLPLHGGEEAVWNGKVACTDSSPAYRDQFQDLPSVVLIDHRQLLHMLAEEDHPGHAALKGGHIVIDDASMLEDTATKAYGWTCVLDHLRAASQGIELLTRFTDILQLWIEKVRNTQDLRYIVASDLETSDAKGVRRQLEELKSIEGLTPQVIAQLTALTHILDPKEVDGRLAWIELRKDGGQTIQSVPEKIAPLLRTSLYERHPTTLLIPPGSSETLQEVIPNDMPSALSPAQKGGLSVSFPKLPLTSFFDAPQGKTIILIAGRGTIENFYVRYAESLEERGVTLVCQGVSGGQGRMRAEFFAAKSPALWLMTPWMFEGVELPPDTADRLVVSALPFDYLSHPVLSRRAGRYRDSFLEYVFPRLLHRLFRICRTFARFQTQAGEVLLTDDRIHGKEYGKKVIEYMMDFSTKVGEEKSTTKPQAVGAPQEKQQEKPKRSPGKKKTKKAAGSEGQLTMF